MRLVFFLLTFCWLKLIQNDDSDMMEKSVAFYGKYREDKEINISKISEAGKSDLFY
ncbi:hypothetical protein SAMN05216378_0508 [Paenibacillus catalpae]|uniref:Uncharacterized protein n=1 Tax=Paenibacillus catalpae TaxID=1045775 RepID=A0A1I1TR21_9BACL|nr:hypothetical protein SAMN05216378_0508 [Paenibacillus catalpae]